MLLYAYFGIKTVKLKDVCEFKKGKSLTIKEVVKGNVPVIGGGKEPSCYHNESNRDGETITVAASGISAGYIQYFNITIYCSDSFSVDVKDTNNVNTKYIYYCLKNRQDEICNKKKGAGIPHVYSTDIEGLAIKLLPLELQERIVNILDNFDKVCNDLSIGLPAEIKARQKQYEYYRDKLLSF